MSIAGFDLQSITFQTKAILLGLAVSLLLFPVFGWIGYSKAQEYVELVSACQKEAARIDASIGVAAGTTIGPWTKYQGELSWDHRACTREEINRIDFTMRSDIQTRVVYSDRPESWLNFYFPLAICFVMLLSAIPFAWQFFLRRLGELSRAIRGLD